jgi:arylsulfatase A-like enzyme
LRHVFFLACLGACFAAPVSTGCGGAESRQPAVDETVAPGADDPAHLSARAGHGVRPGGRPGAGTGGAGAGAASARPVTHPVFSLVDNRLLAHVDRRGGLVVPAGSAAFAKYLRFARPNQPWKLTQTVDGRRAAVLDKKARLELPLTAAQASSGTALHLVVRAPGKRKLALKLNGKALERAALGSGWQLVSLAVPTGLLVEGENQLELDPGGAGLAVEWLQLGGSAPAADAAASAAPAPWDDAALRLDAATALAWYAFVPEGARLVADAPDGCRLAVRAVADGVAPLEGTLSGAGATLDLAPLGGKVARVELAAAGCAEARVTRAALELPGEAPRVTYPKRPKNVVFWVMDTLRYDRVPLWFPGAVAEVPTMQRLADSGAVFLTYYPGGNESLVSHASMFSGLRPVIHRIVGRDGFGWKFDKDWTTLGEVARAAGLYAAGVTANGHIVRDAGYGHGFHAYENPMKEGKRDADNGYAGEKVLARVVEMVDGKHERPFLLFVGTIDTHVPYRAHEPWVSRYDAPNPQPYKGKFLKSATAGGINVSFMLSRKPPAPRDVLRLAANYASSVSYQDDLVGKLLAVLERWGALADTMIIITGDHGEEFWEHGIAGHGGSLREVVVHTPFLVWYPPLVPAGAVVEGVEGIDILPTIADALGQPLPEAAQGESLIPLAQGVGRGYPRPTIASHWEAAWAMRLGPWKLVVENDGESRLYDVVTDPEEHHMVTGRPLERRFVADAFSLARVYEKEWRKSRFGVASNMSATAAKELEAH